MLYHHSGISHGHWRDILYNGLEANTTWWQQLLNSTPTILLPDGNGNQAYAPNSISLHLRCGQSGYITSNGSGLHQMCPVLTRKHRLTPWYTAWATEQKTYLGHSNCLLRTKEVFQKFNSHFVAHKNVIYVWARFNSWWQEPDKWASESVHSITPYSCRALSIQVLNIRMSENLLNQDRSLPPEYETLVTQHCSHLSFCLVLFCLFVSCLFLYIIVHHVIKFVFCPLSLYLSFFLYLSFIMVCTCLKNWLLLSLTCLCNIFLCLLVLFLLHWRELL